MHSQLGLMDGEGLLFTTTYTYRQQTPGDMRTRQRTAQGTGGFTLWTVNSEGHGRTVLLGRPVITLRHGRLGRGLLLLPLSGFPVGSVSGAKQSSPARSLSSLFEPLYPSVKSWVQMLETVMPLGPGCRRGSEQCQPCLQWTTWSIMNKTVCGGVPNQVTVNHCLYWGCKDVGKGSEDCKNSFTYTNGKALY